MEGDYWKRLERRDAAGACPSSRSRPGREAGSWDPRPATRWGAHGGRLYVTCLSIYMLEVYYRHLPIYKYRMQ